MHRQAKIGYKNPFIYSVCSLFFTCILLGLTSGYEATLVLILVSSIILSRIYLVEQVRYIQALRKFDDQVSPLVNITLHFNRPMAFLDDLATNATLKDVSVVIYSGNDDSLVSHRGSEGLSYIDASVLL